MIHDEATGRKYPDERAILADAVVYTLRRQCEDPDVRWVIGPGTEAYRRLTLALAHHLGKDPAEVEKQFRVDTQPSYRTREAEVLQLRRRLRELEG